GIVMASIGGFQLGSVGEPPFNYETASEEDRNAFLQSEADAFGKVVKRGLISPSGVGPSMRLGDTLVNERRKQITYIIQVNGQIASGQQFSKARDQFLQKVCPRFMKTNAAKNEVSLVQEFRNTKNKYSMGKITLSTDICSRFV
ncbi:MAG: hypothetical protein AAGC96_20610, partial [Pseudomonadota bacterium]